MVLAAWVMVQPGLLLALDRSGINTIRLTTRAVGDGQGGGRRDGVGLALVGDHGGLRAESGVGSNDLSSIDWGGAVVRRRSGDVGRGSASHGGGGSGSSETHLDGIKVVGLVGIKWSFCVGSNE